MPIRYQIDPARQITYTYWEGVITAAEWLAHISKVVADPRWINSRAMLIEQSNVRNAILPEQDLRAAIEILKTPAGGLHETRIALVAEQTYYTASKFSEMAREILGIRLMVFNDMHTACIYLGLDDNEARSVFAELRAGIE